MSGSAEVSGKTSGSAEVSGKTSGSAEISGRTSRSAGLSEKISGRTAVCGIIADPVEHSMSPLLQNLFAESTGIDLAYVPFRVKAEAVGEAVRGAFALNIRGLNVTVPHKQLVMEHLESIDSTARDIGAVNTLVRGRQGYKGYNTDVPGLWRALREAGISLKGRRFILIGAGGAAKAAAYLMAREGAEQIFILNRNQEKGEALASYVNRLFGRECAVSGLLESWRRIPEGKYGIIQATSVGMHPNRDQAPIEDREFYRLADVAMDVIYTPAETKFMSLAREAGAEAFNGLNMLLYQGVASYELWHPGVTVGEETVKQAGQMIRERLSAPKNLILIGFMGAGKTSAGQALAAKTGSLLIDTDQEIERQAGMTVSRIFETQGEEAFRSMETEMLRQLLCRTTETGEQLIISTGGGLPLRSENRDLLERLGQTVYLKTGPETILKRLKGDQTRPLLQGEDPEGKVRTMMEFRDPLYRQASARIIDTDNKTPEEVCGEILGGA